MHSFVYESTHVTDERRTEQTKKIFQPPSQQKASAATAFENVENAYLV